MGAVDEERMHFPDGPRSDLESAIAGLMEHAQRVLTAQGRLRSLLQANRLIVEGLDLEQVLGRIVEAGIELVGARYGALGVIAPDGHLEQFIHRGLDGEQVAAIGHLPRGEGVLGAVIDEARPIRLEHVSRDHRSAGFPANHPPMEGFLGVPIRVRGEAFGNLYLATDEGRAFSEVDQELIESLAATAGAAVSNARLFDETRRRQRWSSALAEVTAALLAMDTDGSDVLAVVADRVAALIDADQVCILVPEADATRLRVSIARGTDAARLQGLVLADPASAAARALAGGYAVSTEGGQENAFVAGEKTGPGLAIPLVAFGNHLGVLSLSRRLGGRRFTESDVDMASEFGAQASVAIELARGRADSDTLKLVEERGRIARDLHDHVIQRLFGAGLALQAMSLTLPEAARDQLGEQIDAIDGAVADIRTAIFTLATRSATRRPRLRHLVLDIVGDLAPALESPPRLTFTGPVDTLVIDDLADDVAAVVRESLTNVSRHARAATSSVSVSVEEGRVMVVVEDDGRGLSGSARSSGTENLAVRASARGGDYVLETRAPHGTRVSWSVPLTSGGTS